jgi:hypothetical protein
MKMALAWNVKGVKDPWVRGAAEGDMREIDPRDFQHGHAESVDAKNEIHSCSLFCERPECIKAQRDDLRDKFAASTPLRYVAIAQVLESSNFEGKVQWLLNPIPVGSALYEHPPADAPNREEGCASASRTSAARVPDVATVLHMVNAFRARTYFTTDKMVLEHAADALERLQAELAKSIECNGHLMDTQNKQAARIAELEADNAKARELLRQANDCLVQEWPEMARVIRAFLATKPG